MQFRGQSNREVDDGQIRIVTTARAYDGSRLNGDSINWQALLDDCVSVTPFRRLLEFEDAETCSVRRSTPECTT